MTPTTRRIAIALAVSAALNLFLGGFIAARAWSGDRCDERASHHGPFFGPRALMRGEDPEVEQAMSRVRQRRAADFRAQHEKLRETRRKVSAAFEAEPFDAKALENALAELRAQTADSQRMLHESLIEVAPSLTPEQRARLAHRALERGPGRRAEPMR